MTITSVETDYDGLAVTLVAEFDHPIEQVWELWSDPRKLERWWGPPGYPATVERHALIPGGEVTYSMIGPEGERHAGLWRVTSVDPPESLEFTDAFADSEGTPIDDAPVTDIRVRLTERGGGTRMEIRVRFESREDMDRVIDMGTVEALRQGVTRMKDLLG